MSENRPWRRRLGRWLLVAAGAALVAEVGLRLWDLAAGRQTGTLYQYVAFTDSRFTMRPGATVQVPERYGDVEYRFNARGYRDADHPPERGGRRLVILGDSVTFGLGVAQDRIYPALLQERLGPGYEVVNLAIFAYDSRYQLAALAADGLHPRPALVLLQFYMNDLSISPSREETGAARAPLGRRLRAGWNRLLYASNLYRRLHQAAGALGYALIHDVRRLRFPESLNESEPAHQSAYLAAHPDDATVPAFAAIAEMADLAATAGAELAVLISPNEVQLYQERYDNVNRRLSAFCRNLGLQVIDPLPAFRAHPQRHRLFLDGVHLSPLGHRAVADLLAGELRERGLVGDAAAPEPAAAGGAP